MHYKPLLCLLATSANPATQTVVFMWERKKLESMFSSNLSLLGYTLFSLFFGGEWGGEKLNFDAILNVQKNKNGTRKFPVPFCQIHQFFTFCHLCFIIISLSVSKYKNFEPLASASIDYFLTPTFL